MEEKILCAAIWLKDINPRAYMRPINTPGGVVLCGYRHGHIIAQLVALTNKKLHEHSEHVQGFLTNTNRFVDRKEAAQIWISQGNTLKYSSNQLFSEDLY